MGKDILYSHPEEMGMEKVLCGLRVPWAWGSVKGEGVWDQSQEHRVVPHIKQPTRKAASPEGWLHCA